MSSIIQKVSYQKEEARLLVEKFGELIGVHKLVIALSNGNNIEGIVSEVGKDFILLIEGDYDTVVPTSQILYFSYKR